MAEPDNSITFPLRAVQVKQLQDLSNLQQHSGEAFAFAAEKAGFRKDLNKLEAQGFFVAHSRC